jgi:hypothetical protein
MDDAIERVERMRQRVRAQVWARLAWPWRFEGYPLAELAELPGNPEDEALVWELDFRYRQGFLREEEL